MHCPGNAGPRMTAPPAPRGAIVTVEDVL